LTPPSISLQEAQAALAQTQTALAEATEAGNAVASELEARRQEVEALESGRVETEARVRGLEARIAAVGEASEPLVGILNGAFQQLHTAVQSCNDAKVRQGPAQRG